MTFVGSLDYGSFRGKCYPQVAVPDSSFDHSATSLPPPYIKSEMRDMVPYRDREKAGFPERYLSWPAAALFRFFALTFNAHMIHYNEAWSRHVERHLTVVVRGPLIVICMTDYERDVHSDSSRIEGEQALEVRFWATAPVYVGERYKITTSEVAAGTEANFGEHSLFPACGER